MWKSVIWIEIERKRWRWVTSGKKNDPKHPINEENGRENLDRKLGLVELNYFLFVYDSILILLYDAEETIVIFSFVILGG